MKELITQDKKDQEKDLGDFLAAKNIVDAINANLPTQAKLKPIPQEFAFKRRDAEVVSIAYQAAFHLLGGVPGLVNWAERNPDKFYEQFARMSKSRDETTAGNTTINIVSAIPESPLDQVTLDEKGNVIDIDEDLPE